MLRASFRERHSQPCAEVEFQQEKEQPEEGCPTEQGVQQVFEVICQHIITSGGLVGSTKDEVRRTKYGVPVALAESGWVGPRSGNFWARV